MHFVGSIVYIERGLSQVTHHSPLLVIDGQQRLTTLSVALAALRDVAAVDDPEQFDQLNKKYLINDTEPKGSAR